MADGTGLQSSIYELSEELCRVVADQARSINDLKEKFFATRSQSALFQPDLRSQHIDEIAARIDARLERIRIHSIAARIDALIERNRIRPLLENDFVVERETSTVDECQLDEIPVKLESESYKLITDEDKSNSIAHNLLDEMSVEYKLHLGDLYVVKEAVDYVEISGDERLGSSAGSDAITTPVFNTSACFFKKTADLIDFKEERNVSFEYGRCGNYITETVEAKISTLEVAESTLFMASGVCASTIMPLAGGHTVTIWIKSRSKELISAVQTMHHILGSTLIPNWYATYSKFGLRLMFDPGGLFVRFYTIMALELLRENDKFNLVILDVHMLGMDGCNLLVLVCLEILLLFVLNFATSKNKLHQFNNEDFMACDCIEDANFVFDPGENSYMYVFSKLFQQGYIILGIVSLYCGSFDMVVGHAYKDETTIVVPGALCVLQESGENELVLTIGGSLLRERLPKSFKHDVVLTMALAYVGMYRNAMALGPLEYVHGCESKQSVTESSSASDMKEPNLKEDYVVQKYGTDIYGDVSGLPVDTWSEVKVDCFFWGLYFFGKDLLQVKRFMEGKEIGQILSFYYEKFFKSAKYQLWADCRKIKGRKCIFGQRLLIGSRQHELLAKESKNTLVEAYKAFLDGRTSLEDYVSTLKRIVGIRVLVEAVGIGKVNEDLTTTITDSSRTNHMLPSRTEMPSRKACSSLTCEEIIEYLTGEFRLSKARSTDLFWEARLQVVVASPLIDAYWILWCCFFVCYFQSSFLPALLCSDVCPGATFTWLIAWVLIFGINGMLARPAVTVEDLGTMLKSNYDLEFLSCIMGICRVLEPPLKQVVADCDVLKKHKEDLMRSVPELQEKLLLKEVTDYQLVQKNLMFVEWKPRWAIIRVLRKQPTITTTLTNWHLLVTFCSLLYYGLLLHIDGNKEYG